MCSMFFPRSSRRTRRPFSVSSLAAHPPEIPDPTTIASYVVDCTAASALFVVDQKVHQQPSEGYDSIQLERAAKTGKTGKTGKRNGLPQKHRKHRGSIYLRPTSLRASFSSKG